MTPALRALVFATALSIGGFSVYRVKVGIDDVQLRNEAVDAGFVARSAEATFRVTPEGQAWLQDAGLAAPRYARLQFPVGVRGASNEALLPSFRPDFLRFVDESEIDVGTCASRPGVCPLFGDARPFRVVAHACAWKPNAGAACARLLTDGGTMNPGVENTMQPGQWVGAGCARTPCTVVAGESP